MNVKYPYLFINWAQNESCLAAQFFQPDSVSEIQSIIAKADKVRIVGSGHSWSSICLSDHTLINFDRFNQVLELDKEKMKVRVQPGIKLWQLNEYLDKQGFALTNLGSISKQSVAGAISTGTHGSGKNYQILGSQAEQMSIIKADGTLQVIHKGLDRELFDLCLVNLGALGIISELTFNIVPAFRLQETVELLDFNLALEQMETLLQNTDHFKMWWFPHTDKMILYKHNRTMEPANDSRFRQWFMDEFISVYAYRLFLKVGTLHRDWRKTINRLLLQNFIKPINRIEKSYKVFNVPEPPLHREMEWSFDVKEAVAFLSAYKNRMNDSAHRFNFLQEIRFTKADSYALSPCYGRDSVWVGCYNADNYGWKELMQDFEDLATKFNGRPHWGKEFTVNADYLKAQYPDFDKFCALRAAWDPSGKFENDFIRKIFGAMQPN